MEKLSPHNNSNLFGYKNAFSKKFWNLKVTRAPQPTSSLGQECTHPECRTKVYRKAPGGKHIEGDFYITG